MGFCIWLIDPVTRREWTSDKSRGSNYAERLKAGEEWTEENCGEWAPRSGQCDRLNPMVGLCLSRAAPALDLASVRGKLLMGISFPPARSQTSPCSFCDTAELWNEKQSHQVEVAAQF